MNSPKALYSVTGSVGTNAITAHVILDKKNNSVHMHLYGDIFNTAQKKIEVRQANTKFPEGEGVDLAKQIVMGEFTGKKVQIKERQVRDGDTSRADRTCTTDDHPV